MTRAWIALALATLTLPAVAGMTITVGGAVAHAGTLRLHDGARLSAAALAAAPLPNAYFLGAMWMRPRLIKQQTRWKAGVLYDLDALHTLALARGNLSLATTVRDMQAWLAPLPVTGRRVGALLAPRVVEATPAQNWPLAPGDALFYPVRPTTVRVVGAVAHVCTVPFKPLAQARDYLAVCATSAGADRDWAWVIEPDGNVFRRGIAMWNRATTPLPLAPGALVYVPISARTAHTIDPDFNRDIARFLATQPLPGQAKNP